MYGTPGKVSGRLLDDLKDGGVNFTNYANSTATSAKLFSLSGFSFSGADDLTGDLRLVATLPVLTLKFMAQVIWFLAVPLGVA